jgi:TonB family protein
MGKFRQGVYRVGGDVRPPRAIDQVDPAYSEEARRAKRQGTVLLRLTVGTNGLPSDICIGRAAGSGLDEMAIEAVKSWKFEPATKDSQPVAVRIMVETNFRLY